MESMMSHPGIKRMGPGLWRVRVTKIDDRSGRRVDDRRVVHGDLRTALAAQAQMRVAVAEERPQRIRLRDFAAQWFAAHQARWRHSTKLRTSEHIDEIARGRVGEMFVDAVRPGDVESFLADLAAGRRQNERKLGGYALRGVLAVLSRLASAAVRDLGVADWTEGVRSPVKPRGYDEDRPNCLTRAQLGALWRAAEGTVWLGPIVLTGVLGMRTCEVFALRWRDIEEGRIVLRQSVYRGHFGPPKTASSRRALPAPDEVLATLPPRCEPDELVYPNANGEAHKAPGKRFGDALEALCETAKIPRITPHGLRRSANTALVDASVPAELVRSILGHTDAAMTQRYYHAGAEAKHHAVTQALAGLRVALPVALASPTAAAATENRSDSGSHRSGLN